MVAGSSAIRPANGLARKRTATRAQHTRQWRRCHGMGVLGRCFLAALRPYHVACFAVAPLASGAGEVRRHMAFSHVVPAP